MEKIRTLIINGNVNFANITNPKVKELYDNLKIATDNFSQFDNNTEPLMQTLIKSVQKFSTALDNQDNSKKRIEKAISNVLIDKAKETKKGNSESIKPELNVFSVDENYKNYNSQISDAELSAFLIANPKNYLNKYFEPKYSKDELVQKGLLMYNLASNKLEYKYIYLSGDVVAKIEVIEKALINKSFGEIPESQLTFQLQELQKVVPITKRLEAANEDDRIFLVPHSGFAKKYMVSTIKSYYLNGPTSLYDAFITYLNKVSERSFTISNKADVFNYVRNKRITLSEVERRGINEERQKEVIEDRKQKAKREGDKKFGIFLEEQLLDTDIQTINREWNKKYNGVVECIWEKIPVSFPFSKIFKNGDPLRLTDTQRNGVAFRQVNKSSMLGYDVGVGKTITSIGCVSNAFEAGDAHKALFVVPDATFKKWAYEIAGGKDKDGVWIYGAMPQTPLLQWGNLNKDIVYSDVKEYSESEQTLIGFLQRQKDRLSKIKIENEEILNENTELLFTICKEITTHNLIEADFKRSFLISKNELQKFGIKELKSIIESLKSNIDNEITISIYTLGKIKPIPDKAIILLNYTGMVRLGLGNYSREKLRSKLYTILSQGDLDPKDEAALTKKIDACIGTSMRDARIDIDELGIDFLCIDEAHNMKKSFTRVAGETKGTETDKEGYVKREAARYNLDSGEPSNQGIHAFCLSQYVQQISGGCNLMLTATPFTNNPLEVYSMLALTNYQRLVDTGKENLKDFFDTFIREENQIVINAKNQPEIKPVVVGFNNLRQLRQLIYDIIDYKTGEDANVSRPEAIIIPDISKDKKYGGADTFLQMNAIQRGYMRKIQRYINDPKFTLVDVCADALEHENMCTYVADYLGDMSKLDNADEEAEATRVLRALSFQKLLALSPYLFACNDLPCPTYQEYVEESPKLLYTMQCIKSVKDWHESRGEAVSGQVIYMNVGTRYFPLLQQYLVNKIGFKENEVELIYGDITKTKKESIKERFLAGEVKIVIGSGTIKEGIDLQNRSTVLYILVPDWNPTDFNQVKGRIWRQGNMFGFVRIVNVLMADTSDVFIYQKLQEKTQRLKELLDRNSKKSQLDLDDVNPEEIKENLITDPKVKASLQIKRFTKEKELEISLIKNDLNRLEGLADSNKTFSILHPKIVATVNDFNTQFAKYIFEEDKKNDAFDKAAHIENNKKGEFKSKFNPESDAYIPVIFDVSNFDPKYIETINRRTTYALSKMKDSTIYSANGFGAGTFQDLISNWRGVKSDFIKGIETLESMGFTVDKLDEVIATKKAQITTLENEILQLPLKLEELAQSNEAQREVYLKSLKTIEERVNEFADLNHYMQYKMKKPEKEIIIEDVIEIEENVKENVDLNLQKVDKPTKKRKVETPNSVNDKIKSLKNRIEIITEMLQEDPNNKTLKNRLEIIEEMLQEAA